MIQQEKPELTCKFQTISNALKVWKRTRIWRCFQSALMKLQQVIIEQSFEQLSQQTVITKVHIRFMTAFMTETRVDILGSNHCRCVETKKSLAAFMMQKRGIYTGETTEKNPFDKNKPVDAW